MHIQSFLCSLLPLVLLPCCLPLLSAQDDGEGDAPHARPWPPRPFFAPTPTNLTVISGRTAFLPCRVHLLGARSVTWMRGRDLHILTAGRVTYSADDRFTVLHSPATDDWTLQIRYTELTDAGLYKCQVNSQPKIVRDVHLSVTDKRVLDSGLYRMPPVSEEQGRYETHIVGAGSRYLQTGSTLLLECVVTYISHPPAVLLWYHRHLPLSFESHRGGIAIQVERSREQMTSQLLVAGMQKEDSGTYTCAPLSAPSASVNVHVSEGEVGAAVQQGRNSAAQGHYHAKKDPHYSSTTTDITASTSTPSSSPPSVATSSASGSTIYDNFPALSLLLSSLSSLSSSSSSSSSFRLFPTHG